MTRQKMESTNKENELMLRRLARKRKNQPRISENHWPITMHVHGAEIRPTFDGNPLSWTDNVEYGKGYVGIGTFSLN